MNKNFKVFQIHGLSGLLLLGFISTCLFFGFVAFPVWVVMAGWNEIIANKFQGPIINYYQAFLLWTIVIILVYTTLKNSISIKVHTFNDDVDEEEINKLMQEAEKRQEIQEKTSTEE
jgi:hypothetical protein